MASQVNYFYVYFNIKDFAGNETLSAYTLPNTPLTFYPDFSSSFSTFTLSSISNKLIRWDFGDGSFSTQLTASHQYVWPGDYKIRLTVYDKQGNAFDSSYQPTVNINNFVIDQILFRDYRKFIYDVPASKINDPLYIDRQSSWQSYNSLSAEGYTINLYASGAIGDYQNVDNFFDDKWSHLRSLSRFLEKQKLGETFEFKAVDKLKTTNDEIYCRINNGVIERCSGSDNNSVFAGTTGSCEFYYVDDRVKNYTTRENPIFLYGVLDNSKYNDKYTQTNETFKYVNYPPHGFQNIQTTVLPIIKIRHNPAERLTITTTGIDGEGALSTTKFYLPEISWQNTEIPFVIRFKDNEGYTTKTYPPLSSSTINSFLSSLSSYDLQFGLARKTETGLVPVTSVKFYEDFTPEIPQSIGAFYKGYFIPTEPTLNCVLTASLFIQDPLSFPKDSLIGWVALPQYNVLLRFFRVQIYTNCQGYLTLTISANQNFFNSNNNRNVYAIQVAPSGAGFGEDYQTWFADGTSDKIFKFDNAGYILSSFSLSSFPYYNYNTSSIEERNLLSPVLCSAAPGSLVLDGNSDLWVALFDSVSAIKIDKNNGYIKAVAVPDMNNLVFNLSSDYNIPVLSGFAGENLLLPSSLDTDIDDNLWVSYTNPASNFLVKYDTNGAILTSVSFPWMFSPVELCVDRNKFVWLTTYNLTTSAKELTARDDYLYKFDSFGNVVSGYPLSGFKLIGNITVDGAQNAWVVENRDTVTKIDGLTRQKTYYSAGSGNSTNYIQSIGGIAADTSAFIWVINDLNNKIYFIDTLQEPKPVNELLSIDLNYPPNSVQNNSSAFEEKRFQAYGDWLGSRWLNKYIDTASTVRILSAVSNEFNIYPLSGSYNVYKINEDFNALDFYKSLVFSENLEDKNVLFNKFIGSIVGGVSAQPYELGKTVYEKIANYVSNNSDIDFSNLDQLLSFCQELSIQFEQYNYPFPPQLMRLVNLLSIKHKKLWGEKNKFALNFNKEGTIVNPNFGINLGTQLSTLTSTISSGIPLVAYENFSGIYSLINKTELLSSNQYLPYGYEVPLSSYSYDWGWGLVVPKSLTGSDIGEYYSFYRYVPIFNNAIYDNIIDWNNPYNTLNFYNSSFESWSENNGVMQNLISYELTKGLRLFLSATDLTYNN